MADFPEAKTLDEVSPGDILSAVSLVIGLITALTYFAGWTYAFYYFDRFHIPLSMLELPFEHYMVYGSLIAYRHYWMVLVAVFCCWLVFRLLWLRARRVKRRGIGFVCVVSIVVAFFITHYVSARAARLDFLEQRNGDYDASPRVRFVKEGNAATPETHADVLDGDCGRLVAATKERLFLIRPVRDVPAVDLVTIVVPLEKSHAFVIESDYTSCQ